jgi:diadenosine tetraphosphatase ApaH/serine/threonine PP2A family protein phosphatase
VTTWALLSDVHGRGDRLARVLADAARCGASRILCLGDLGSAHVLDQLNEVGAEYVFGNWEASGLRGMSQPYRGQVARWSAQVRADGFWAAHASPVWPDGLVIGDVIDYLQARTLHWTALFPSLARSPDARQAAFDELAAAGVPVFFHGHTHVQEAWSWAPGGSPNRFTGSSMALPDDGACVLVGIGSVGAARDGHEARYVLYDAARREVTWQRV